MMKNMTKVVEGNWDELKEKIKKQWGKLSDKDISQMEGSYDKLVSKLKETYHQTENKVLEEIQSFLEESDFKEMKDKAKNEVKEAEDIASSIKDKIEKSLVSVVSDIKTTSLHMEEDVVAYVKKNPVKAIIFTALAGALFSKFYFNKRK